MNKFYCISIVALSFVSQSSFAQLHVDSLGHVGVGVTTPLVSNLAVGKAGSIYYNAHVTGPGSGVYGEFKTYTGSGTTHSFGSGVHGYGVSKGTTYVAGLRATVERGSHSESGTDYAYGVYATAADAAMTKLNKSTADSGKETTALFNEVTFLPGKDKATYDFTVVDNYSATPTVSEVKKSMNIDLTGYAIQTTGLTTGKGSSTPATTAQQIYDSCLTASVADGGLGNII